MRAMLSHIVSEFETEEQKSSYNDWFCAKVEEALLSKKPRLPHDAAMAKVQAMREERRNMPANRLFVPDKQQQCAAERLTLIAGQRQH
jgi:hypothetical protein